MSEINLTNQNFEQEVLKSTQPVLVDFFAPWCGPCQMMAPIINEVAKKMEGKAKIVKINIDKNPELAEKYNVMSVPALIIFKDGKIVEQMSGMQAKEVLVEKLNALTP